ncbi:hypothetical protein EQ500_00060 [Lactobacillus sp. XV13L]|nr:hypothetical protein [Lactobacillus sp. XV13L]
MKQQVYRQKIIFWLRFTGWLCILPAWGWLRIAQLDDVDSYAFLFWGELAVIILFASSLLATAREQCWLNPKNVFVLMIVALVLVPFVVAISLYLAYRACRKLNDGS